MTGPAAAPNPGEVVEVGALRRQPEPAHGGGQASLTPCSGPWGEETLLFKRYHPDTLTTLRPPGLHALVRWRRELPPDERSFLDGRCAWPLAVATERGAAVGVLMRPAPPAMERRLRRDDLLEVGVRHLDDLAVSAGAAAHAHMPYYPPPLKLAVLATLIETMRWLHDRGHCIGDVQPRNVLFAVEGGARTLVVDCDACVPIGGEPALPMVEPELYRRPRGGPHDVDYDYYKLAWIVVRCLQEHTGAQELDRSRLLAVVDTPALDLFERTCADDLPVDCGTAWARLAERWPMLVRADGRMFVRVDGYELWPWRPAPDRTGAAEARPAGGGVRAAAEAPPARPGSRRARRRRSTAALPLTLAGVLIVLALIGALVGRAAGGP